MQKSRKLGQKQETIIERYEIAGLHQVKQTASRSVFKSTQGEEVTVSKRGVIPGVERKDGESWRRHSRVKKPQTELKKMTQH